MSEQELKHVIALLLEDAKRLLQLEPNAGTEARIFIAKKALGHDEGQEAKAHSRMVGSGMGSKKEASANKPDAIIIDFSLGQITVHRANGCQVIPGCLE